jgi:hypothetical protein
VRVSVIAVTGIPAARASASCARTSGVAFWLLYTYTLICFLVICRSTVTLSAAAGSPPSLIALRKAGGVSRRSPRAGASIAKMDSEAPTGVPDQPLLICSMVPK